MTESAESDESNITIPAGPEEPAEPVGVEAGSNDGTPGGRGLGWPGAVVLVALIMASSVSWAYVATSETRAESAMFESLSDDPCLVVLFTASLRDEAEPPVAEYRDCKNATKEAP